MNDSSKGKEDLLRELNEARQRLHQSEGRLAAMLLFVGDPMSMLDRDLNVIWANEVAKRMFGDDIVGKKWKDAFYNGVEPVEGSIVRKTFIDGKSYEQYTQTTDKNGKILYLHCASNTSLRDDNGRPSAVMEICRDVTELKKTEQGLQLAYHELKETQKQLIQSAKMAAVGQLAGGVAHEVKNPLAVVVHCANYLEGQKDISEEERLKKVRMIKEAAFKADKIIRSLLDFSRPRPIELKSCDMRKIFDSALELVRERLTLENVNIVKEIEDNLPMIHADENQMEQVFINILFNALQAMPKGGRITVRMYTIELNEPGHGVGRRDTDRFRLGEKVLVLEIEDTGEGIPADIIDRVFDPFFTIRPVGAGTGLGLTIARSIIEGHRGHIHIESKEHYGTKIVIKLPILKQ